MGDIHFLEVIREPLVKRFEAVRPALDAIELREPLGQIERLGVPFLDAAQEILHLFADGFSARLQLLDRVLAE